MARSDNVLILCDYCLFYEDREVDAVEETTASVGKLRRTLALCEKHYQLFVAPLREVLGEIGSVPEDEPERRRPKAQVCPVCTRRFPDRKAVASHVRRTHQRPVEDVDPKTDEWWTTADVARYLGLQIGTVSSYRMRGQMPLPERRIGRTWVWRPKAIVEWRG